MSKKSEGSLFKKGDVVWVRYRNDPLWPALIHNVYPKKITYVFFPLPELGPGKKPTLFSCNPKNVYRVSVGEQTPRGSNQKLVEAIRAAKAYLVKQGRQEGSEAPLRPDSKPRGDDDEEDEDLVDVAPAVSKESRAETETDGTEPDEEDASGSEEGEDDFEDEEVEDEEDGMPVLKRGRFSPPLKKADSSSLEDPENGDEEGMKNGALLLDGFTQTLEENYLSILGELFKEKMVRTYSVPSRGDMRISLAGCKFLTNDNVDILFQRIVDFINEREEQCRILPAIHLASTVLFPEVITRVLMIYKGLEYEAAKLCVYSPENGTESSVDTDKCTSSPPITGLDALVRVACEERAKVADSSQSVI